MTDSLHWAGPFLNKTNQINHAIGYCLAARDLDVQAFRLATYRRYNQSPALIDDLKTSGYGNSARVLRILACELALKALFEHGHNKKAPHTHNLMKLYRRLPPQSQQRLEREYNNTTWTAYFGEDIRPNVQHDTADVPIEKVLTEFVDESTQARYSAQAQYREKEIGPSSSNAYCLDLVVKAAYNICRQEGWDCIPWSLDQD